jgi:hypothetical protein
LISWQFVLLSRQTCRISFDLWHRFANVPCKTTLKPWNIQTSWNTEI